MSYKANFHISGDFLTSLHRRVANESKKLQKVKLFPSYRLAVAVLALLALSAGFATQVSMSSALVCMIRDDADNDGATSSSGDTSSDHSLNKSGLNASRTYSGQDEETNAWRFSWNFSDRSLALTCFFFGNYVMQMTTGSILLPRFGNKVTVVGSLVFITTFQLLAVPSAFLGINWLYLDRFLAGISTGPIYPSMLGLMATWAPPFERSLLFGIAGVGTELGNMFAFAISGVSCGSGIEGGWPFVFYIVAGYSLVMACVIAIFVTNLPDSNRFTGAKEKRFIAQSANVVATDVTKVSIPFKKIVTSLPVWAILDARLGMEFIFYTGVTQIPVFLADVLKLSQSQVSFISGMPYLAVIPTVYLAGVISDKLVSRKMVTITTVRKLNDATSKMVTGAMYVIMGFLPENSATAAFVINTVAACAMALGYLSYVPNTADLSPAHAGFLIGFSTTSSNWVSFTMPLIVVAMTQGGTRQEWQNFFYLTLGLEVVTSIFYTLFASGELQPWAKSGVDDVANVSIEVRNQNTSRPTFEDSRMESTRSSLIGQPIEEERCDVIDEFTPLLGNPLKT